MKKTLAHILSFCFFSTMAIFVMAAARGSGTYTTRYRLYQPATGETQGWGTDSSTNSINNNFAIIDSSMSTFDLQARNTNYIQLVNSLQSGATFYTASGTVNIFTIGTSFTAPVGVIAANSLAPNSTSYIQLVNSLQSGSTFYVSSGTINGQAILAATSGNVGISTVAPAAKFSVVGDILASSANFVTIGSGAGNAGLRVSSSAYLATTGGFVGIGTISPNATLNVIGISSFTANIGGPGHNFTNNGAGHIAIFNGSGNVGIGTPEPSEKLHVKNGNIVIEQTAPIMRLSTGSSISQQWQIGNDISVTGTILEFRHTDTASAHVVINRSGNVGIGTVNPATRLNIVGTNPIIRLGQSSDCELLTPGAIGEICAQNSGTCPIAFSTSTSQGGFNCLTLGSP